MHKFLLALNLLYHNSIWICFSLYKLYYNRGESNDLETNSNCNISELQDNNNEEENSQVNESETFNQVSHSWKQSRFKR